MPSSGLSLTLIVSHSVGVEASSSNDTSNLASQLTFSAPVVSSRTCLVTVVVSARASSCATARLPALRWRARIRPACVGGSDVVVTGAATSEAASVCSAASFTADLRRAARRR